LREIQEEIGLTTIKLKELIGVHFKPEKNDLVFTFIAQKTAEIPTTSDEADRIEYFSVDEIPQNTSPKQRDRIIEFFKNRAEMKTETVFYNQMGA
jgi:ADP-ribose pyrophosphatase YjhB (NUDIX family)